MRRWLTLSVVLTAVIFTGCASTMIGRKVDTSNTAVCYCHFLPAQCSIAYEFIHIDYNIRKGNSKEEYSVSGQATYTGSSTWTEITNGRFRLLLIADEHVFQEVSIPVFSGDISRPIVFERVFNAEKAPSHAIMGFNFSVQG